MSDSKFQISIVLPCFNVIGHLEKSLGALMAALNSQSKSWEIIIVDDGSHDGTSTVAESFHCPTFKIIRFDKNRGKYAAIKCGISASQGDVVIFTDSDLPYGSDPIFRIYNRIKNENFEIVCGDRTDPTSTSVMTPRPLRRLASKVFSSIALLMFNVPIRDTQCGLKGFESLTAKKLASLIKDNRFGGDLELLYLANKYRLKIGTVPVHLSSAGKSSVNVVTDGLGILIRALVTVIFWKTARYPKKL